VSLSRLKFIALPYVDVTVLGNQFKVAAVSAPEADDAGAPKSRSFFLGLSRRGFLGREEASRLSQEQWGSLDGAYKAWWDGFTINGESADSEAVARQLVEDGSAVAI
jgi:hypothetical protein